MNSIKKNDLQFGFNSEEKVHNHLESCFGSLTDTREEYGKYYEFDKYNDDCFIEIKTRRIRHNQYYSLMFGENKSIKAEELKRNNPELRIFFIWVCTDGTYYWEHGSTEHTVEFSGRTDRGCDERNACCHIKTSDLKELTESIDFKGQ